MRMLTIAALAAIIAPSVADAQRFVMRTPLRKLAVAAPAAPTVRKVSCPSTPSNKQPYINGPGTFRSQTDGTASQVVAWANQQEVKGAYILMSYNGATAVLHQTDTPPQFGSGQWTSQPDQGWYVCGVQ